MTSDRPDILVLPPVALLVAIVAAVVLDRLVPLGLLPPAFASPLVTAFGLADIAIAILLAAWGFRTFKRAGTNVDPRKPALTVVRDGPYMFTRNPMYLGMVILMLGLAFAFSVDWALLTGAALWAVLNWGVIAREERYLRAKFGAPYEDLLRTTRRWI